MVVTVIMAVNITGGMCVCVCAHACTQLCPNLCYPKE